MEGGDGVLGSRVRETDELEVDPEVEEGVAGGCGGGWASAERM